MATSFTEVYDLFLVQIQDYKIDILFDAGAGTLNNYLEGFLKFAIVRFDDQCREDLQSVANFNTGTFTTDISLVKQIMLAKEMKLAWIDREVNNVLQMENLLSDTDFKRHSESANLDKKRLLQDKITEQVSQDELDYFMRYQRSARTWEASDFFV